MLISSPPLGFEFLALKSSFFGPPLLHYLPVVFFSCLPVFSAGWKLAPEFFSSLLPPLMSLLTLEEAL